MGEWLHKGMGEEMYDDLFTNRDGAGDATKNNKTTYPGYKIKKGV
jgi:hypothetical protein